MDDFEVIDQNPDDFEFEDRSSISVPIITQSSVLTGKEQKLQITQPQQLHTGDRGSEISLLDDDLNDLDNLADHLLGGIQKGNMQSRRPTAEEKDDLRKTDLVKRRNNDDSQNVSFEDFNFMMVVGRGTFGKVFLAEYRVNGKVYAIKSIRKDILIQHDQIENTLLEKDIMFECDHPFLVGMDYLFQNDLRLYFVMPFIRGGELYKVF